MPEQRAPTNGFALSCLVPDIRHIAAYLLAVCLRVTAPSTGSPSNRRSVLVLNTAQWEERRRGTGGGRGRGRKGERVRGDSQRRVPGFEPRSWGGCQGWWGVSAEGRGCQQRGWPAGGNVGLVCGAGWCPVWPWTGASSAGHMRCPH